MDRVCRREPGPLANQRFIQSGRVRLRCLLYTAAVAAIWHNPVSQPQTPQPDRAEPSRRRWRWLPPCARHAAGLTRQHPKTEH